MCAVFLGGCRCPALPFDPISLVLAQRNGVEPPKKSAFFYPGGSTIRVSATASVVFTHLRPTFAGGWCLSGAWYVCADTLGGGRWPALPFDPISLVLAQRNGVEPPKKSAFLPRRLHHPRERCCLGGRDVPRPTWGGAWWLTGRSSQLDAVGGDVGASSPWERRVGPNMSRGGTQARFFGAPPRFFAQEQRNGVERAVGGNDPHPRKRRTRRSVKKKGGNPWRGFPLSPPLLRFNKHKRVRPLRRAARGFASGLHRL